MVKVHSYERAVLFTTMKFARGEDLNTRKQIFLLENVGYFGWRIVDARDICCVNAKGF